MREDEPLAYLYIVLEGLFGVRIASIPDSEIGRVGPGEIIGEISFLENMLAFRVGDRDRKLALA